MSLYNLIHGENPTSQILLAMLGLTRDKVPRYRDCYFNGEEICVHTRTGGGNRDYYESAESCRSNYPEYFTGTDPAQMPSGPWNKDLRNLENYSRDEDDDYDPTYATFYFAVPENFKSLISEMQVADATPAQKWETFMENLKDPKKKDDPQVQRVMAAMQPMFKAISEKLK